MTTDSRMTRMSRSAMRGASTLGVLAFCATLAACPPGGQTDKDGGRDASTSAELESIAITPTTDQVIPLGATARLAAKGTFSDGTSRDITGEVTWASADKTIADFKSAAGEVKGLATGSTTVTAAMDGKTSPARMVVVTPKAIVSIAITPNPITTIEGMTVQLTAIATYTDGSTSDVTNMVSQHSEDGAVATVDSDLLVTAVGPGSTKIVVLIGSISGEANVTVAARTMLMLDVTAVSSSTSAAMGENVVLKATGSFDNTQVLDVSSSVTWSSSDSAVATVDSSGKVKCVGVGMADITATAGSLHDKETVNCSAARIVSLALTPDGQHVPAGATYQLKLVATYSDGTTNDITAEPSVTWTSNRESSASVSSPGGLVTSHAIGRVTITANVGDASAVVSSASVTFNVDAAKPVSVTITRQNGSTSTQTPMGVPVQYIAMVTFTDGHTSDATSTANWTSSDMSVVADPLLGRAVPLSVGSTVIKAQLMGETISATTILEVVNAQLLSIAVTTADNVYDLPKGASKQLIATGTYTDASTQNLTAAAVWTSETPATLSVSNAAGTVGVVSGLVQQAAPVTVTATVTENGVPVSGTRAVRVVAPVLASITVTGPTSVAKGLTITLSASGILTDGTPAVLSGVTWSSTNTTTAPVSGGGIVTGKNQGMVRITASVAISGSAPITGGIDITVTAPELVSVVVGPPNATVAKGASLQLTATGIYSDNTTTSLTAAATWTSDNEEVAKVSGGLVQSFEIGTANITAKYNDKESAPLLVTVTPPKLIEIELAPLLPTIPLGSQQPMSATGKFTDGSTQDVTTLVTWSSTNPAVASIGADGVIATHSQGAVTIEAISETVSATTIVTVGPEALVSLEISPANPAFPLGTTTDLTVMGTFTNGAQRDLTGQVQWVSSDDSIATVDAGTAYSVKVGIVTVTATSMDGQVSTSVPLEVLPEALIAIDLDPLDSSFSLGLAQQLTAIGTYTNGEQKDITQLVLWSSNNELVATVSGGLVQSRKVGTATISATSGLLQASTTVTVTPALVTALRVEPTSVSIPLGRTVQFTAIGTFTDGLDREVTASVSWSSTDNLIASMTVDGLMETFAVGSVVLTASIEGQPRANGSSTYEATVPATVQPKVLDSILISGPDGAQTFPLGRTLQLKAMGTYSDGSEEDLTTRAVWTSDNTAVATIGATSGLVSGLTTGETIVRAVYQGVTSTDFKVTVAPADIVSISIFPTRVTIKLGQTTSLLARGTFTDGQTYDITSSVAWASEDTFYFEVGPTGVVSGVRSTGGTPYKATASRTNLKGETISGQCDVTIDPKGLVSMVIAPTIFELPQGTFLQGELTGTFTDGSTEDVTRDATWTKVPGVTSVFSITNDGILFGDNPGTAKVVAKLDGITVQADVKVGPPELTRIDLSPGNPVIPLGADQQMIAQGFYTDGSLRFITEFVTWSSSAGLVASIDSHGKATGIGLGTATITAELNGVTATMPLVVTQAALVSIEISPDSFSLPKGMKKQLTLTGTWTDGSTQDLTKNAGTRWSALESEFASVTSNTDVDGVRSWGLVRTADYEGTTTIQAKYGGLTAEAQVRVVAPVLVSIKVQPTSAIVPLPLDQQFTATGTYSNDEQHDVTSSAFWASSNNSVATVTNNVPTTFDSFCISNWGCVQSITPGTATISATIGSVTGTAVVSIGDVGPQSITIEPIDPEVSLLGLSKGDVVQVQAMVHYTNGDVAPAVSDVVWSASNTAIATVTGTDEGTLTGVSIGTTTISATFGGKTGNATVKVGPVSLKRLEVAPVDPTLYAGQTLQLTVKAIYSDSSFTDVTTTATWDSDEVFIAKATAGGLLKGFNEGEAIITASFGGKSKSITVTVGPPLLTQVQIVRREDQSPPPTCATTTFLGATGLDYHFVAIARYSDGSYNDVTNRATWAITPVNQTVACSPQNPCLVVEADGTSTNAVYGLVEGNYLVRTIYGRRGSFKVQAGFNGTGGTVTGAVDITVN